MRIEYYFCTIKACVSHVFTLVSPEWFVLCACVSVCLFYFPFFLSFPPSHFPLLWAVLKLYYEPPAYNGRSYVTISQPTADELTAIHFLSIFSHTANILMPVQSQNLTNCKGKRSCLMSATRGWKGQRLWYAFLLCTSVLQRFNPAISLLQLMKR